MDNAARYSAVNTKVRALEGQLLKDEDYINLLSKRSVPEVAVYLKQRTHYRDILQNINEDDIHRGRLENLLKESHINGLEKIVHYFYDRYREFYKSLFIRYEIEDLKIMIRNLKTGRDTLSLKDSLMYIGKFSKLDRDTLLSSKNISDFVKSLRTTVYYDYLRPLVENKENLSLFSLEMTLDLAYFDMFYDNLKLLNKEDRSIMEDIQGINVDLLNIQWIYRGIKFYNLPSEEIFNYTIAYGKEFTRNDIKSFCYLKNLDEFQKLISKTRYGFLFDHDRTRDIFMERRMLRYQYFKVRDIKRRDEKNISQVIAYNLLLEMEVRDIISIIENIRYGMSVDEAKRFLIRKL